MSEEGRQNDTRAIAQDLIETMLAMRESCYAFGLSLPETQARMKSFLDHEIADLRNQYDLESDKTEQGELPFSERVNILVKEMPYEARTGEDASIDEVNLYDYSMN